MSKTKTAKTKIAKAVKPAPQVKKDAKGRFWVVPNDGGAEQGPFATRREALDAKAGDAQSAPAAAEDTPTASKTVKTKKAKEPKEKKLSAIDAAAQVLASSKEPLNAKELIEAMTAKALWISISRLATFGKKPCAAFAGRRKRKPPQL